MIEGAVGAGLYWWLGEPWMAWLVEGFRGSILDIAKTTDERTLLLGSSST
jgi:hypothetical protein